MAFENAADLDALVSKASVLALGPGLGQNDWARQVFSRVLQSDIPKVLDADALNLLAEEPLRRNDWVLTPHPGEAGPFAGYLYRGDSEGSSGCRAGVAVALRWCRHT